MSEQEIEQLIQDKGATHGARITPADIDAVIVSEAFTVLPSQRTTLCELTLRNGFSVRGESYTVSVENFDDEIGRKIAREDARRKVWQLEAYLLCERMHAYAGN